MNLLQNPISPIVTLLSILAMILAVLAVYLKDLLAASVAAGFISLVASIIFLYLQAPDVAMTEAAIGAGITTVVFVIAVRKTERYEK